MTRCLDEARLQSYFDGELSIELMEGVTSHLASCVTCAAAARELEEETALLTTALAADFESSVPTERLRQRIDAAVLGERYAAAQANGKSSGLAGFFAGLLNFGSQRTLGYASLAVLLAFAAIFGLVKMKSTPEQVAQVTKAPEVVSPVDNGDKIAQVPSKESPGIPPVQIVNPLKAGTGVVRPIRVSTNSSVAKAAHPVKLMPGERSYLKAIARLDSTINSNKKGMRPSLQVEYERNLAVVDRAIAATRSAAKSNPNDPDAADFMFAAYQSKVDLLNTIADARLGGARGH
jgi:hypothetical protein